MKRLMLFVVLLNFASFVFAQKTDVIVKKNIFDPKRGEVEKTEEESGEITKEELPKDMPILDGIMTVGKYKKAIFRYREKRTRKFVSTNVSEGDEVEDAKIKKIEKDYVIVFFGGKSYKLNVDSKYDSENSPKKFRGSVPKAVTKQYVPAKGKIITGRNVKPVKPTIKKKINKGLSNPFGSSRKSGTKSNKKGKVHPF